MFGKRQRMECAILKCWRLSKNCKLSIKLVMTATFCLLCFEIQCHVVGVDGQPGGRCGRETYFTQMTNTYIPLILCDLIHTFSLIEHQSTRINSTFRIKRINHINSLDNQIKPNSCASKLLNNHIFYSFALVAQRRRSSSILGRS